ncbi:hypothetical protein [Sphingobacterium multivorum]|uniref:DUF7833 domain-containing protein n=1 Tax=Sphingobacterium multivorum TaxID=28454 RepID=UPI003DA52B22
MQKLDNGGSKIEQGGSTKIEPHNTIINNTSNTTREAGEKKLQNSFGVYDSIDDAIAEMKNHTDWKTSMCKQTGVSNVEDCDRWIDKFRDHAIASGITKFNLKDLKYHCFSWLRKRIGAGDKLPVVIDKTKKHIPNISHLQFH